MKQFVGGAFDDSTLAAEIKSKQKKFNFSQRAPQSFPGQVCLKLEFFRQNHQERII